VVHLGVGSGWEPVQLALNHIKLAWWVESKDAKYLNPNDTGGHGSD